MRKTLAEDARIRAKKTLLKLAGLVTAGGFLTCSLPGTAPAGAIKTVFVIAMENHNWTQPTSQTSPGQILGNPAAPYINSLVTPGNPNAAQVSYASNYQQVPGIPSLRAQLYLGGSRLEPRYHQ